MGLERARLDCKHLLTGINIAPVIVLEAADRPAAGLHYYVRLFSPAAYSSMPGLPFPGDPDRYPSRDEVEQYLEQQAAALPVEL